MMSCERYFTDCQVGTVRAAGAAGDASGAALRSPGGRPLADCVRRLGTGGSGPIGGDRAAALLTRGTEVLGDALLGVALLGSRVRGDAGPDSDLDVLFAVDSGTEISRDTYRRWDALPSVLDDGPTVDPHFAHLPSDESPGNLWGEAAMEGVVLFERGRLVSEAFVRIRRAAAGGRLVRRVAHGQPYWAVA